MKEIRFPYYCVVNENGTCIWRGRQLVGCEQHWLPGTFWGGGMTPQGAYQHALQYARGARLPKDDTARSRP